MCTSSRGCMARSAQRCAMRGPLSPQTAAGGLASLAPLRRFASKSITCPAPGAQRPCRLHTFGLCSACCLDRRRPGLPVALALRQPALLRRPGSGPSTAGPGNRTTGTRCLGGHHSPAGEQVRTGSSRTAGSSPPPTGPELLEQPRFLGGARLPASRYPSYGS